MLITTEQALLARCESADVIVMRAGRPVLVEEVIGDVRRMIKLWWVPRRGWRLRPHQGFQRFCSASEVLQERGVIAPRICELGEVAGTTVRWVVYPKISGDPLNHLSDSKRFALLPRLSAWVRSLHERGCYSRALSLANVLVLAGEGFGLTDVSDTRFTRRALGYRKRVRNLGLFFAHPRDTAWWLESAGQILVNDYARAYGVREEKMWSDVARDVEARGRRRARRRRRRGLDRT